MATFQVEHDVKVDVSVNDVAKTFTIERKVRGKDAQYHSTQFITLSKDVIPELIEALQEIA